MRLLSRYLLRELTAPFLFSVVALTAILMLNQIAKRLGDLVGKGLTWQVIGEVLGLSLPFIIALTLPMAVLVAVLYTFSHLAADNEITAMRASGISVGQLLRPVLIAGAMVAIVNFFFIDQVLPRSNARLKNLQSDIGRKKPTFKLEEQAINDLPPSLYFLRASRIETLSGRLRDVTIYDLGLADARRVIYADSGVMAFETGHPDLQMLLYTGRVHEYKNSEPGSVHVTTFVTNTIRVKDIRDVFQKSSDLDRGDREMSTCEMLDQVDLNRRGFRTALATRERLTQNDLHAMIHLQDLPTPTADTSRIHRCGAWRRIDEYFGRLLLPAAAHAEAPPVGRPQQPARPTSPLVAGPLSKGLQPVRQIPAVSPQTRPAGPIAGQQSTPIILSTVSDVAIARNDYYSDLTSVFRYSVEIHKKFSIAVSCLNFVIIGMALALRFPRGGMGLVIGASLSIFMIYYVGLTAGESLAKRGLLDPAIAMWVSNVIIGIVGLWGVWLVSRESGSTRGGDLSDLLETLFGWVRRRSA